jgi:hypothetical protein
MNCNVRFDVRTSHLSPLALVPILCSSFMGLTGYFSPGGTTLLSTVVFRELKAGDGAAYPFRCGRYLGPAGDSNGAERRPASTYQPVGELFGQLVGIHRALVRLRLVAECVSG